MVGFVDVPLDGMITDKALDESVAAIGRADTFADWFMETDEVSDIRGLKLRLVHAVDRVTGRNELRIFEMEDTRQAMWRRIG